MVVTSRGSGAYQNCRDTRQTSQGWAEKGGSPVMECCSTQKSVMGSDEGVTVKQ